MNDPLRPFTVPSNRSIATYAAGLSADTVMRSVSLVPTRSPANVLLMWTRDILTPSWSSYGSSASNRSRLKVPSALAIEASLAQVAASGTTISGEPVR